MFGSKKGASNVVGLFIGITIAVLVAVSLMPVIADAITDANIQGAGGTILELVPLFLAIAIIVVVTKVFGMW